SVQIISMLDIIKPDTLDCFIEIYFIQELLEIDLHRVIRTQSLTDDHCQVLMWANLEAAHAL
ncbi:hypothetical protein B0H14DRAFT_2312221, partial [Mycena olivaceomarginata]